VLRFIVDFLAPAARLVVEIDGGYHAQRVRADAPRDEKLRRAGYRVLRIEAEFVIKNLPVAVERIRRAFGEHRIRAGGSERLERLAPPLELNICVRTPSNARAADVVGIARAPRHRGPLALCFTTALRFRYRKER
jgi:Protein of unknown function (DUF559)